MSERSESPPRAPAPPFPRTLHPAPLGTYRRPCASSSRIFSSTACSAAARQALVSSSFCRTLSPGEAPSGAAGDPATAEAAARGGLAGTCSAGVPGDGGLAGLALSDGGVLAALARAAGGWRAGEGAGDGPALPGGGPAVAVTVATTAAALGGLGAVGGGGGLGDTGGGVPWARFTSAGRSGRVEVAVRGPAKSGTGHPARPPRCRQSFLKSGPPPNLPQGSGLPQLLALLHLERPEATLFAPPTHSFGPPSAPVLEGREGLGIVPASRHPPQSQ